MSRRSPATKPASYSTGVPRVSKAGAARPRLQRWSTPCSTTRRGARRCSPVRRGDRPYVPLVTRDGPIDRLRARLGGDANRHERGPEDRGYWRAGCGCRRPRRIQRDRAAARDRGSELERRRPARAGTTNGQALTSVLLGLKAVDCAEDVLAALAGLGASLWSQRCRTSAGSWSLSQAPDDFGLGGA